MPYFKAKMHLNAYSAPPGPLAGFYRDLLLRGRRGREGTGRKGGRGGEVEEVDRAWPDL